MMCIWKILLLKGGCGSVIIDFLPLPHCYGHWHLFFQAYRIVWNNFGQNHFLCLKSQKYFECLNKLGNQRRWSPSSRVFTAVSGMEYGVWSLHCRCCCGNWDGMKILSVPSSPNFAAVPTKSRPLPPLLRRKWSEVRVTTAQTNWISSPPTYKLCWPGATI